MGIEYAIIVKDKTRFESLIERFNTKAQAKFYIESQGGQFEDYEREHEIFHESLQKLQSKLSKNLKNKILERPYLSNYIFAKNQLIVVLGRDGLVANTAKYSRSVPIVGVNPDKSRYDGVLLPFDVNNFIHAVENVIADQFQAKKVRFAEARLQDGQRILAFNDLFIGAATHVSARYQISFNNTEERHSSSGIIVSTQAGSTGWLSSIFNMVNGIMDTQQLEMDVASPTLQPDELLFAVREPYKSVHTQVGINAGVIHSKNTLTIESNMPNQGVIFSDGVEQDFLQFNSGTKAVIRIADEYAELVLA